MALIVLAALISGSAVWFIRPQAPEPPVRKFQFSFEEANTMGWEQVSGPAISPDGQMIVYRHRDALWIRRLDQLTPQVIPGTESGSHPFWSPDGRFIGFIKRAENPSAGNPIFTLWKVSVQGGTQPRWSRESGELFFVEGSTLMAVKVSARPRFTMRETCPLFSAEQAGIFLNDLNGFNYYYDVSADGQRFVVVKPASADSVGAAHTITVVQNWIRAFEE